MSAHCQWIFQGQASCLHGVTRFRFEAPMWAGASSFSAELRRRRLRPEAHRPRAGTHAPSMKAHGRARALCRALLDAFGAHVRSLPASLTSQGWPQALRCASIFKREGGGAVAKSVLFLLRRHDDGHHWTDRQQHHKPAGPGGGSIIGVLLDQRAARHGATGEDVALARPWHSFFPSHKRSWTLALHDEGASSCCSGLH